MIAILIIIGSLLVVSGQALLKNALETVVVADKPIAEMYSALIVGFFTPKAIAALFILGLGSLVYFLALRLGALSVVVPATAGLIIAFTAIVGCVIMKDPMPMLKIAGIFLIIGGVYLVSRPA